jgi:hypothetical protein
VCLLILALAANDGRRASQGNELRTANRPLRNVLRRAPRGWTWAWIGLICVAATVGLIMSLAALD